MPRTFPSTIALYSPLPRSGKSSVAEYLRDVHNYVILPFATPIKDMAMQFLQSLGVSALHAYRYTYVEKEVPIPELDPITGRRILETLGTEWGRTYMGLDIWLQSWEARARRYPPQTRFVVDDLRRLNEFDYLTARPQTATIRLTRPGLEPPAGGLHLSTGGELCDPNLPFTRELVNDSDLFTLFRAVDRFLTA
jgi:hypothetical protein